MVSWVVQLNFCNIKMCGTNDKKSAEKSNLPHPIHLYFLPIYLKGLDFPNYDQNFHPKPEHQAYRDGNTMNCHIQLSVFEIGHETSE